MKYIKAIIALVGVAVIWISMLLPFAALLLVAFAHDRYYKVPRSDGWLTALIYVTDILTNGVLGGYKRTTISAELGNLQANGSETGTVVAMTVDYGFIILYSEYNHCSSAMEEEDKYFFKPFRALVGATTYLSSYAGFAYLIFN